MQTGTKRMSVFTYCKTRAFRAGYEDFRLAVPPRFGEWGKYNLAYEEGRQAAAFAVGRGEDLPAMVRSVPEERVGWLAAMAMGARQKVG